MRCTGEFRKDFEGVIRWPSGEMYRTDPQPTKELALLTAQDDARGSGGSQGRAIWARRYTCTPNSCCKKEQSS